MKFTKFSKTFILQSICEQLLLWIAPPSLDITVHLKLKVSQLYSMIHVKYLKTRQHFLHPSVVFTELYNTEAVAQRCSGKHLCQSLFFNKVSEACNFIKEEKLAQVFSCEFCEISKNIFFTEHLWTTASEDKFGEIIWK